MNETDPTRVTMSPEALAIELFTTSQCMTGGQPEAERLLAQIRERAAASAVASPPTGERAALARVERLALTFEVAGNEFIAERIRAAVTGVEAHGTGTQQPEADALVRVRAKATEWAALAPADDWGDTPQDTALADAGRYLLALIDGAGAPQQPDTEAQPPHHRWYTEQLDPVANEWAPGWRFTDRSEAVERYRILSEHGAPAERRLVRETTTYTVEEPAPVAQQPAPLRAELKPWQLLADQPDEPLPQTERVIGGRRLGPAEQQAAAEAEQDDTMHACPGRWGGPNCRCFDAEPAPGEQQAAAADGEETHRG